VYTVDCALYVLSAAQGVVEAAVTAPQ
jgi:hypothetical protein